MAYFLPEHRGLLIRGSTLAELIISKETRWSVRDLYDIKTRAEMSENEKIDGVFAQLMRLEAENSGKIPRYSICLQDSEIFDFLDKNTAVDILSFITFIMTHELIHVHRFSTGQADFYCFQEDEEVYVDTLTRLFMAKNPVTGLNKVLALLDNLEAAPLYNVKVLVDHRRFINAHL
jgi:hypothetical protein